MHLRMINGMILCTLFLCCEAMALQPPWFNRPFEVQAECNINGVMGKMVSQLEAIPTHGVTWGPGVNPQITGVISDGGYNLYVNGVLTTGTANYRFSGENSFADFVETSTYEKFRVQWVETPQGVDMVVNPFGGHPTRYSCRTIKIQGQ